MSDVIDGPGRYETATGREIIIVGLDADPTLGCEWEGRMEGEEDWTETWASSGKYRPHVAEADPEYDVVRRIDDGPIGPSEHIDATIPSGTDLRRESLKEVEACVCKDRQNTYGDAEDNFSHIAAIANVVLADRLKAPLTALDIAAFSACIKLARIRSSPDHLDNWTDLAGYAVCGAGIVKRAKLCESSSVASNGSSASQPASSVAGDGATTSSGPSPFAVPRPAAVLSTP